MTAFPVVRGSLIGPVPPLADPRSRLFLTSAALLFAELFLIRWIPGNIVSVGFFTNFILIASFLGIGLGVILGRNGRHPRVALFPILLFLIVKFVSSAQLNVLLGSEDEIYLGSVTNAADANPLVIVGVVVLSTAVMAALALPVGPLFRALPPLRAYAIDVLGSLTGIAGFALLSATGVGPVGWVAVLALLAVLLGLGTGVGPWSAVSVAAMIATLFVLGQSTDIWSPYQRLSIVDTPEDVVILANGIDHQRFAKDRERYGFFYTQVAEWYPGHHFEDTLIIGAGNGNDVAAAMRRGDGRIDAVEIDSGILQIGRDLHPVRPYQDPRVTAIIDDGRAFLRNTDRKYDLIVFAEPDSLTLFSTAGQVRLESFLFTREAFRAAAEKLKPDGIIVLYNFYWQSWLVDRLGGLLEDTFGRQTIITRHGDSGHAAVLANGPGLSGSVGIPPGVEVLSEPPPPTVPTDDWPFLYLRGPAIASYHIAALGLILAFALLAVGGAARVAGLAARHFSPHFFLLGVAFMLLETRSLVTFGLLFGNTWIVNAFAFFAVLASVLVAIVITARYRPRDARPFYAALFASLALAWLVPPASLLFDPPWLRYVVASGVAFAPVFFANLCFTHSFRDSRVADMAFASNLLGAVVGGTLEYVALITGYQALIGLVVALYAGAYLAVNRTRWLADRQLGEDLARAGSPVGASAPASEPAA